VSRPEIRTVDTDELGQVGLLGRLAFGGADRPTTDETSAIEPEDTVVAVVDGRVVGMVNSHRFTQTFGGRPVPCAGVAGVVVAPDQRGTGLGRAMLAEATSRARRDGRVLGALFPTASPLYRSIGYEVAGWWHRAAIGIADLPRPDGTLTWEATAQDDPAVAAVVAAGAAHRDGWVVPPTRWWSARAARTPAAGAPPWTWVARRDGEPVAAVVYDQERTGLDRGLYDLAVDVLAGVDHAALVQALAFLGGHGTTVDRVRTTLPPALLARLLPGSSRPSVVQDWPWMLRIHDLPAAIAARGWPAGVTVDVDLAVTPPTHDPDDPVAGRWCLSVADGAARCTPGSDGAVTVAAGDLAAV